MNALFSAYLATRSARMLEGFLKRNVSLNLAVKHPQKSVVAWLLVESDIYGRVNTIKHIGTLLKSAVPTAQQHVAASILFSIFQKDNGHVIVPNWSPTESARSTSGQWTGSPNPVI